MFRITNAEDKYVLVATGKYLRTFTVLTVNRARTRFVNKSKIRKPKEVKIDGLEYIFTRNEWQKGKELANQMFDLDTKRYSIFRADSRDNGRDCKKLKKLRDARARWEADAAGASSYH